MVKHMRHLLTVLCCAGLVLTMPACWRDRQERRQERREERRDGKVVKEKKYKKETKVKHDKAPKRSKVVHEEVSSGY